MKTLRAVKQLQSIRQQIRVHKRCGAILSFLVMLAWLATWAFALLLFNGCAGKPDAFDRQWDEAVLRAVGNTQQRSLMRRETSR